MGWMGEGGQLLRWLPSHVLTWKMRMTGSMAVAGIVHIPSADTFYCHREEAGDGVREFRPLHSSWLRICCHADAEEQPRIASGGYVKRVISSFLLRLRVWGGDGFPVRVMKAVQFHDSNVSVAPLLPPDVHTVTPPLATDPRSVLFE